MNTTRDCGCKGYRSCFICEKQFGIKKSEEAVDRVKSFENTFVFCSGCQKIYPGWDTFDECKHKEEGQSYPGVQIIENFISVEEEATLIKDLDDIPWSSSQSGRRKQNFGPKANFKKRKTKPGDFKGFPATTKFIQDRFLEVPALEDYKTVEQCSIEYRPETGACIDPHIDDCWIWGERIVQLNLMSSSVLSMIPYKGDKTKYNLPDIATFPRVMGDTGTVIFNPFRNKDCSSPFSPLSELPDCIVRIPLPPRSLLIFYGEPRYNWEHCILREDIKARRIVVAYREFTPPYLPGGADEEIGKQILDRAKEFW